MLIQRAGSGTLPPPTVTPDWAALERVWDEEVSATAAAPNVVRIGPSNVALGHDDFESEDLTAPEGWQSHHEFGWDNEHPKRTVAIGAVDISTRPITNKDYRAFLVEQGNEDKVPASWVRENEQLHIRTLYGPVQFEVAQHWPLAASYDEIEAYARARGGRLPTEAELIEFRDRCDDSAGVQGNIGFRNWHYVP